MIQPQHLLRALLPAALLLLCAPGTGQSRRDDRATYLVVAVDLNATSSDDRGFLAAATAAAGFHGARVTRWDGRDVTALATLLERFDPENVLLVLRPDTLDINLHRRVLLTAMGTDDDIFVDHAFGYLTARDGDAAIALWQRIEGLHANGLANKTWIEGSVTSSPSSLSYPNGAPAIAQAAGFAGEHWYVSTNDPDNLAFAERKMAGLKEASVIQFTGNGDPQGVWVFDGRRNMDRSKHWPYSPEKVGHDPEDEMRRITADRFRGLELPSPIIWSGTCHSAAVRNVYVEGDIVSTFGRTEVATRHELDPDKSLGLAILDAGAAAFLAPIGANHGMSVSMETDFAFRHGASLGETLKSTYDDVALAADGSLVLDFPEEGKPHPRSEYVMQGGGANRILIGDPALRPFQRAEHPLEKVSIQPTDTGLRVTVRREKGFVARSWDIYGRSRPNDWRVITRVELTGLYTDGPATISGTATATDSEGGAMPYQLTRCRIEEHQGHRYLHLQANGLRREVERKAVTVTFHVTLGEAETPR